MRDDGLNEDALRMAARESCRAHDEFRDMCQAQRQPDGSTTCSCRRWDRHVEFAEKIVGVYVAAAALTPAPAQDKENGT